VVQVVIERGNKAADWVVSSVTVNGESKNDSVGKPLALSENTWDFRRPEQNGHFGAVRARIELVKGAAGAQVKHNCRIYSPGPIFNSFGPNSRGDDSNHHREDVCPKGAVYLGGTCDCGGVGLAGSRTTRNDGTGEGIYCECKGVAPKGQVAKATCSFR
jgi:hypothetical protein